MKIKDFNSEELEKKLQTRYKKKDKKKNLKMRVSGSSVKKLQQVISNKQKLTT